MVVVVVVMAVVVVVMAVVVVVMAVVVVVVMAVVVVIVVVQVVVIVALQGSKYHMHTCTNARKIRDVLVTFVTYMHCVHVEIFTQ